MEVVSSYTITPEFFTSNILCLKILLYLIFVVMVIKYMHTSYEYYVHIKFHIFNYHGRVRSQIDNDSTQLSTNKTIISVVISHIIIPYTIQLLLILDNSQRILRV